jgi:hypothetical protein
MKKTYKIPILWQSCQIYEVDAEDLQEASTKAVKQFLSEPDDKYLDDSFEIDDIVKEDYNETYSWLKLMEDL